MPASPQDRDVMHKVRGVCNGTLHSETAKLVDIGILDLNMFRKFLKNSNSMFDVALSM